MHIFHTLSKGVARCRNQNKFTSIRPFVCPFPKASPILSFNFKASPILSFNFRKQNRIKRGLKDGMAPKKNNKTPKQNKGPSNLDSSTSGKNSSSSPAGTSFQSETTPDAGGSLEVPVQAKPKPAAIKKTSIIDKLINFVYLLICMLFIVLLWLVLISNAGQWTFGPGLNEQTKNPI